MIRHSLRMVCVFQARGVVVAVVGTVETSVVGVAIIAAGGAAEAITTATEWRLYE